MKTIKLTAAIAATVIAGSVQAQISGGDLAGAETSGSTLAAVSAIAVIGDATLLDGLRALQGFDASCNGSTDVACAPSLSSAEVRAIANGSISQASGLGITGLGGLANTLAIAYSSSNVGDALASFLGGGNAGGLPCGQGQALKTADGFTSFDLANDAAVIGDMSTQFFSSDNGRTGFVHATELDGSVGFIKLDGVAPSLLALQSSNYNLVSNLSATGTLTADAGSSVSGIEVGVASTASGDVAYHGATGAPLACAPLNNVGGSAVNANGGAI